MFIITTDGQENASHRYTSEQVKKMIEHRREKYGWEFLFIGANIDAVETAARYGIDKERAVNYNADSEGTRLNYEVMSETICSFRESRPITADWKKKIDKDFKTSKVDLKLYQYIEENGYEICGNIRETYIDGVWNKETENEWLTEIQIPVK